MRPRLLHLVYWEPTVQARVHHRSPCPWKFAPCLVTIACGVGTVSGGGCARCCGGRHVGAWYGGAWRAGGGEPKGLLRSGTGSGGVLPVGRVGREHAVGGGGDNGLEALEVGEA